MRKFIATILGIGVLLLYLYTTSPYLQAGDSAEMAAVTISLGVPHQPSYPLYTLIGHWITNIPIPYLPHYLSLPFVKQYEIDLKDTNYIKIYRTGVFSAVSQALATVYMFRLIIVLSCKLFGYEQDKFPKSVIGIAALTSGSYAVTETIWLYATKPEVFALNNLFALVLLVWTFEYWTNEKQVKFPKRIMLLFGIAFSHHQTIILLLPMILLIHLIKQSELSGVHAKNKLKSWFELDSDKKFNRLFPYTFLIVLGTVPFFVVLFLIARTQPLINWGEVSNLTGLVRALIRADYGTIGAYLSNTPNPTPAIDQITFFVEHITEEISLYLLIIAIIGYMITYRQAKKLAGILIVGFIISGPLFLMYANFALENDFSKATVTRFYMLPMIFIFCYIGLGLLILNNQIIKIKRTHTFNKDALFLGHTVFLLAIVIIVSSMAAKNAPIYDNLTYKYAKTMVDALEDNALVMITGDIPTMSLQYMQAVEGEKKERTIFSPGQFHLDWFQKQLRSRYPSLKIPEPYPGKQFTSATQVAEANWGKQPIYVSPEFVDIDPELAKKYVLWPKGYLLKLEDKTTQYKLEEYREENSRLYESIKLDEFAILRSKKYQLESPLITFYARHFYNVGAVFNAVHRYEEAVTNFERSLTIDPTFSENYKALGSIYYLTPDYPNKDLMKSRDLFINYLQTKNNITVEEYNSIINIIKEIEQNINKINEEELKRLKDETVKEHQATGSAEASVSAEAIQKE